jgi:hypothetical protein
VAETETAIGQLTLPVSGTRNVDDQHVESIGVQKPQFTGEIAHPATHRTGEQIPAEFFILIGRNPLKSPDSKK